ncbi:hypothetical protein T492DRAFT_846997 [Pavlovales sp. CCMP2436]|nr:hypothetical protein T492DRAFT_846997 [Pavlovales sp. CCMP2436]
MSAGAAYVCIVVMRGNYSAMFAGAVLCNKASSSRAGILVTVQTASSAQWAADSGQQVVGLTESSVSSSHISNISRHVIPFASADFAILAKARKAAGRTRVERLCARLAVVSAARIGSKRSWVVYYTCPPRRTNSHTHTHAHTTNTHTHTRKLINQYTRIYTTHLLEVVIADQAITHTHTHAHTHLLEVVISDQAIVVHKVSQHRSLRRHVLHAMLPEWKDGIGVRVDTWGGAHHSSTR